MENSIVSILGTLGGLLFIISSILNWDTFFKSRKVKFIVDKFGINGARIFYFLLGLLLLGTVICMFFLEM